LESVNSRLAKLEKEARTGDKRKAEELAIAGQIKEGLEKGELVVNLGKEIDDHPLVKELGLLTAKPQIYLLNGSETDVSEELKAKIGSLNADYLIEDLGTALCLDELIKKAYQILGLISFFTTGEDETRAWTIEEGAKAPQAAGVIHTDFENKFIRAEVIQWDKLLEAGSWIGARQKGLIRLEGKDYVFQDGDVTEIRHG